MSGSVASTKVAAIQMQTEVGQWAKNLALAQQMIEQAAAEGAKVVALPEFFTGAVAPSKQAYAVVLPAQNPAVDMLIAAAIKHNILVGGSMLVAEHGEVYNRYFLAEPNGSLHHHDKDIPTMWENAFYIGGSDDGVLTTSQGKIGAAVCWELIRCQTVKRLQGVSLAMTGTHWWTLPTNWSLAKHLKPSALFNRYLSEKAPVEFALRLGAPVIQASHCGPIAGSFPLGMGLSARYETAFVGATQIVDAQGNVLAYRSASEGPGIVYADIVLESVSPVLADPMERFWIPDLPPIFKGYWMHQNRINKAIYKKQGRLNGLRAAQSL